MIPLKIEITIWLYVEGNQDETNLSSYRSFNILLLNF